MRVRLHVDRAARKVGQVHAEKIRRADDVQSDVSRSQERRRLLELHLLQEPKEVHAPRTANRGGSRPHYKPETYWDEEIVSGMTPEERAVMFGPASPPKTQEVYLTVDPDGTVHLDN